MTYIKIIFKMSQQDEILKRLLSFYKKRYNDKTLESKINEAIQDLIDSGDITLGSAMKFLAENDIEPSLKAKKVQTSSYNYDPCGGGGYNRSHC